MSYFGSPGFAEASTGNSSTANLSGGATFTGTWELCSQSHIFIMSKADVAGTLFVDYSNDGSTTHSTYPSAGYACSANIPEVHVAVVGGRYFRVRYVNGASAQSSFSLGVQKQNIGTPLMAAMNQSQSLDSDAILARTPFPWLDYARSLWTGVTPIKKFGRNPAVGTSFEPIALSGVYQTPQSGSATTLRIAAGGNANDTAAGSGAREVTLEGLDENFDLVTEAVATAGASASSATTATFTRLFRAYVSSSGTYATAAAGSHSADIVIENGAGGTTWAEIDAAGFPQSQSEIGAYSIPSGYSAYVFLSDITIDTTKSTDLIFFAREGADETSAPYTAMRAKSVMVGLKANAYLSNGAVPFGKFTGPCDIGFLGRVNTGTASIAVEFEIILVAE